MTDEQRFRDCLQDESAWFSTLSDRVRSSLAAAGRFHRIKAGAAVYRQGDSPDGLYAVLEGRIRLVAWSPGGVGCLLLIASPGMWFGEVSTIDGEPRQQDALAQVDSLVARIPLERLVTLAVEQPDLWRQIGRLACSHQRDAIRHIQDLLGLPLPARVAKVLLACAAGNGERVILTQEELAGTCGMGRQTANAILRSLARAGAVQLGYRAIIVADARQLTGIAAGEIFLDHKE